MEFLKHLSKRKFADYRSYLRKNIIMNYEKSNIYSTGIKLIKQQKQKQGRLELDKLYNL